MGVVSIQIDERDVGGSLNILGGFPVSAGQLNQRTELRDFHSMAG